MEDLQRILAAHRFFADLAAPHLKLLVGCATNVRVPAGTFLARAGEPADRFYLVRAGKVVLEIVSPGRAPLVVQTLREGDILGWSWLVPPHRWTLDAVAAEETRALALDGACLRGKCEADHDLGYALLKRFAIVMAQRLEATRLQLLDVYRPRS
jgi:CRP-like cAMP-binding protein